VRELHTYFVICDTLEKIDGSSQLLVLLELAQEHLIVVAAETNKMRTKEENERKKCFFSYSDLAASFLDLASASSLLVSRLSFQTRARCFLRRLGKAFLTKITSGMFLSLSFSKSSLLKLDTVRSYLWETVFF